MEFDWDDVWDDDGNVQHIARHNVFPWEVEQVFRTDPVWIRPPNSPANEYMVLGPTASGRMLRIHGCVYRFGLNKGCWRTFTALKAGPTYVRRYYRDKD